MNRSLRSLLRGSSQSASPKRNAQDRTRTQHESMREYVERLAPEFTTIQKATLTRLIELARKDAGFTPFEINDLTARAQIVPPASPPPPGNFNIYNTPAPLSWSARGRNAVDATALLASIARIEDRIRARPGWRTPPGESAEERAMQDRIRAMVFNGATSDMDADRVIMEALLDMQTAHIFIGGPLHGTEVTSRDRGRETIDTLEQSNVLPYLYSDHSVPTNITERVRYIKIAIDGRDYHALGTLTRSETTRLLASFYTERRRQSTGRA